MLVEEANDLNKIFVVEQWYYNICDFGYNLMPICVSIETSFFVTYY